MLTLSFNVEGVTLPLRALPSQRISEEQIPGLSLHVNVVSRKANREHVQLEDMDYVTFQSSRYRLIHG